MPLRLKSCLEDPAENTRRAWRVAQLDVIFCWRRNVTLDVGSKQVGSVAARRRADCQWQILGRSDPEDNCCKRQCVGRFSTAILVLQI